MRAYRGMCNTRRVCTVGRATADMVMPASFSASCTMSARQIWLTDSRRTARAIAHYLKGCELDYMPACQVAGAEYALGKMVPRDPVRALSLLQAACDRGEGGACQQIEELGLR